MKKIFRIFLIAVCAMSFVSVNAQEEEAAGKPNVFIDYFYYPSSVKDAWADNLRSCVIEGINATGRVELIDASSKDALKLEEERRKNENIVSGGDLERLKVMTTEGANYLITGTVTSITTEYKTPEKGDPYHSAACVYTLKVINPSNGKLVSTKNFKHGEGFFSSSKGNNEDEAVAKVCRDVVSTMKELVEDAFKI